MVDEALIVKCLEEYKASTRKIYVDNDVIPRGGLHFDGERLFFDLDEDDQLDDEEEISMVYMRASL